MSYIIDQEVKQMSDSGLKTPMGDVILAVEFADGKVVNMPTKRFEALVSETPIDASASRDKLCRIIASTVYGLFHEFDLKTGEVEPTLAYIIKLVNDGSTKAGNILWGIENEDERSMLAINDVLLKNAKDNG